MALRNLIGIGGILAGTAIGGAIGGPPGASFGAFIGGTAGGILGHIIDPIDSQLQPPTVQLPSAAPNQPLPIVYGTAPVSRLDIIWHGNQRIDEDRAGLFKFDGPVTGYTVTEDVAFRVCAGPATVLKIWRNENLVYDIIGTGETNIFGSAIAFFDGGSDQIADTLEVSTYGIDDTSRHQGICYFRIEQLDVTRGLGAWTCLVSSSASQVFLDKNIPIDGIEWQTGVITPDDNFIVSVANNTIRRWNRITQEIDITITDTDDLEYSSDDFNNSVSTQNMRSGDFSLLDGHFFVPGGNNDDPGPFIGENYFVEFDVNLQKVDRSARIGDQNFNCSCVVTKDIAFPLIEYITFIQGTVLHFFDRAPALYSAGSKNPSLNMSTVTTGTAAIGGSLNRDFDGNVWWFGHEIGDNTEVIIWAARIDPQLGIVTQSTSLTTAGIQGEDADIGCIASMYIPDLDEFGIIVQTFLPNTSDYITRYDPKANTFEPLVSLGQILYAKTFYYIERADRDNGVAHVQDRSQNKVIRIDFKDLTFSDRVDNVFSYPEMTTSEDDADTWFYDSRIDGGFADREGGSEVDGYVLYFDRCAGAGVTLQTITEDIQDRVGYVAGDRDASGVASVTGVDVVIDTPTQAATVLEALYRYYNAGLFDSGFVTKSVLRGLSPVFTVNFEELGAYKGRNPPERLLPLTDRRELSIPRRIEWQFFDENKDYQEGSAGFSRSADVTASIDQESLTFPGVQTVDDATKSARRLVKLLEINSRSYSASLPPIHWLIEPFDIGTITDRVATYTVEAQQIDLREDGIANLQAVSWHNQALAAVGVGVSLPIPVKEIISSLSSTPVILDIPLLRDGDEQATTANRYLSAKHPLGESETFVLQFSTDQVVWNDLAPVNSATWGTLNTALPAASTTVIDHTNTLDVIVASGSFSSAASEAAFLADDTINPYVISSDDGAWELGRFQNATMISSTNWQFDDLLRGQRNTENHLVHGVGSVIYFLDVLNFNFRSFAASEIGSTIFFRARPTGVQSTPPVIPHVAVARSKMPYSGTDVNGFVDLTGVAPEWDIDWMSRSRFESSAPLGEPPWGENIDSFDFALLDGPQGTELACITETVSGGADTGSTTLSVGTTSTFTRPAGSFLDDGFKIYHEITGSGFANGGNNATFRVLDVVAGTLTVEGTPLTTETGGGDEQITAQGSVVTIDKTATRRQTVNITEADEFATYGFLNDVIDVAIYQNSDFGGSLRGEPRYESITSEMPSETVPVTNTTFNTDLTGWTQAVGSWVATANQNGVTPHEGALFANAGSVANAELNQIVDLQGMALFTTTKADNEQLWIQMSVQRQDIEDEGRIILEALDGSDVLVEEIYNSGSETLPYLRFSVDVDIWTERNTEIISLPTSSRKIRIRLIGVRIGGSVCNTGFDTITCDLYDRS